MTAPRTGGGDNIVYTTKEILASINEQLSRQALVSEQLERRLTTLEGRADQQDQILKDMVPQLKDFIEKMNVQEAVEEALKNKKIGITNYDRVMGLALATFVVFITTVIPHFFG